MSYNDHLREAGTIEARLKQAGTVFVLALITLGLAGCRPEALETVEAPETAEPSEAPETRNEQVTNRGEGKDQWWDALPRAAWSAFEKVEQSQPWFEVYQVVDGVFAIYEPGQFEEVISYLIVGNDRALLFDTGLGIGDMRQVTGELTELDVTVINSHGHYDHIGGNHAFDHILSPDTEYTRGRAEGLEHAAVAEFVGPGWIWKETPAAFSSETYHSRAFEITRFLEDREVIDLGGRQIEVIFTPGHAPDALCLLDRAAGLLFTGDTFYLAPLYTHLEGSDFEQYRESTRLLAGLVSEVKLLMPAHNEPAVDAGYLGHLHDAFEEVAAGMEPTVITDGNREFRFDGFSIVTR